MSAWLLFFAGLIALAGIYAILTLALNVEAGLAGLWDLGIVAFFAVGAYTYTLFTLAPPGPGARYTVWFALPMWAGFLASGIVAGLFGYLIGKPALRLRGEYLLITTFAASEVLRQVLTNEIWLTNGTGGFNRLSQPFRDLFPGSSYQYVFTAMVLVLLALAYWAAEYLANSPFGRTLRAIRENEQAAVAAGKDLAAFKMRAFVFAAVLSGYAGAIYVWYATIVVPSIYSSSVTFTVWTAMVIGGIGNNRGAVLGAFFLIIAQEFTRFLQVSQEAAQVLAASRLVVMGLILILVLRFRPEGLLPERRRTEPARAGGGH